MGPMSVAVRSLAVRISMEKTYMCVAAHMNM